jgi:hypothetical protein
MGHGGKPARQPATGAPDRLSRQQGNREAATGAGQSAHPVPSERRADRCAGGQETPAQAMPGPPPLSARQEAVKLSEWTILLTNVPAEQLCAPEARVLMRSRWQLELLWRLWKERGQLDIWRSEKPMRILCEIYAKLIGMIIQHWLTMLGCGCWQQPSMVKASQVVQMLAINYALSLSGSITSTEVLQASQRAMLRCRLNTRKKRPNTSQLLLDPR